MSGPDYSGEAVTVFVDAGYGPGMWRNACPVDCGWHGSDWTNRDDAERFRDGEKKQHRCLRAVREDGHGNG